MNFCPWCVVSQIPVLVFISLDHRLFSVFCQSPLNVATRISVQSLCLWICSVDSHYQLILMEISPPPSQYILQNAWSYLLLNSRMTSLSVCGLGAYLPSWYSACSLWVLWPWALWMFGSLPPPLYSLPNCSRGRSILSTTDWWIGCFSEWSHTRNPFPALIPETPCGNLQSYSSVLHILRDVPA